MSVSTSPGVRARDDAVRARGHPKGPELLTHQCLHAIAQALPLDPAAMHPERSLLLDTFLNVLLCHGASIAQLRRASKDAGGGGGGGPGNAALSALEEAAHSDLEARELQRFPAPETFECDQYSSKARYVVQKLNPDVPLSTFLAGLYKAIVS